jgi:hypothetical protein
MEAKFPLLIEGILFGMKRYPSAFQKHYIIIFIKNHIFSARFGLRLVQRVISPAVPTNRYSTEESMV